MSKLVDSGQWSVAGRLSSVIHRRRPRLALLVAILLLASAIRFVALDNFPSPHGATPPGLEHDEVAHWLINRDILAGNHAIYFAEAYGHEALYHYVQAYFGALVGDHALALRLPSAYLGVLLVAVSYALGRRLFGPGAGLLSAAFLAVLFWPVFYSRLALRAIMLPVLSGVSAVLWWRAFGRGSRGAREQGSARACLPASEDAASDAPLPPRSPAPLLFLAGTAAGLSLHTYMAARAVPIFYGLFTVYLFVCHRPALRQRARGVALFWAALIVVALPLAWFLLNHPGAEVRTSEVDAPLRALLAGDVRPVLTNAVALAGLFGVRGDPLWRQGIAGRVVFDPLLALLFYGGVALCLWRWREPRHAFLLLWLGASLIPSLVTIDAPSTIRAINLLPVVMLFPWVALQALVGRFAKSPDRQVVHTPAHLSTAGGKLSTDLVTTVAAGALGLLFVYHGWSTAAGLWRVWAANDEVRFVWQAALTEAAAFLDDTTASGPVAVGGWSPESMDPPTMALSLRREDLSLRFFDPLTSLILPVSPDGQPARVVRPAILPLAPPLEQLIARYQQPAGEFVRYEVPARLDIAPPYPVDAEFGGQLRLLGYDADRPCNSAPCEVVTYWLVTAPAGGPRRIFLHLMDESGALIAQDDRLGAPAEHWRAGDIVFQLLTLPSLDGELRVGMYDPETGERLVTGEGGEYVVLE
ncbi:glycosyltransferase family 39 protein [Promineifilum sp.]|uniref:glycosyltransferase family 39 protein n=1 Tax=Promineifilum sp. TaxID=2664178 RepID=UPI0035B144CA